MPQNRQPPTYFKQPLSNRRRKYTKTPQNRNSGVFVCFYFFAPLVSEIMEKNIFYFCFYKKKTLCIGRRISKFSFPMLGYFSFFIIFILRQYVVTHLFYPICVVQTYAKR